MKKIIIINRNKKTSLFQSIAGSIFKSEFIENKSGAESVDILKRERPDYVILNNIKPVNGMDMMSVLRHIDGNIRLRVAILELSFFRRKQTHVLSPAKSR